MTCIVGLEHEGRVWIGADSAGVDGGLDLTVRADEKVWADRDMAFGFTSSFRMGQILRYSMPLPPERLEVEANARAEMEFMATTFVNRVREALKEGGFASVEDGVEQGGCFLVGWRGRLYSFESDFQVGRAVRGYQGVGCGGAFAQAALWGLLKGKAKLPPRDLLRAALRASEEMSGGVRSPFRVVSV